MTYQCEAVVALVLHGLKIIGLEDLLTKLDAFFLGTSRVSFAFENFGNLGLEEFVDYFSLLLLPFFRSDGHI